MSNSKILKFRVEADSRRAILELDAFSDAIANIGYLAPGQARALKAMSDATVANAKASKEAASASLSLTRARAAQAVADDRAATAAVKAARATATADKDAAKSATDRQKNSRAVMVAFDRETRDIEAGARRQGAALKAAEAEYDALAKKSQKSFDEVRRQIRATDAEMARSATKRKVNSETLITGANVVGGALTAGVTVPLVAAGTYSLSTAIDWEEAFAKVKEFVGGSTGELAKLRADLRGLALDAKTGLSFTEAANLASYGGQLGVARENLTDFVRQVSYLGQAGDLSGEEAARGINKISQALKLPPSEFARVGSALAAMGSVGSSTVGEIIALTERIASAGRVAGMTAPQLLAVANAMISLGQEPEAAATAFQSVVDKIGRAVSGTTKTLPEFARVAGMTTKEFAATYRKDALGAVLAFVAGLDKMPPKSGAAGRALDALGITQVRQRTAVLNLAAGHETLSLALKTATNAYTGHNVAEEKAAIAASSTKRELETLKHEVEDAANDFGEALIPALRDALRETKPFRDGVKSLAQAFHEMTPEAQSAWTKVALAAAVAGPTILALAGIAGAVVKLRDAYLALKGAAAGAGTEGALLRGAGALAKGVAGGTVLAAPFIFGGAMAGAIAKENTKTDQNTINDAALPGFLQTAQARGDVAQKISQLRERIQKIDNGGPYSDRLKAELAALETEEARLGKAYDSQRATYFKGRSSVNPVTSKPVVKPVVKPNGDGAPLLTEEQKREAERKRKEAEAAQKKADLDANAANKEALTGKLGGLTKSYTKTLETLRNDATPEQLPFLKKQLASLSGQILETATAVADSELAQARISDPKNTRAATARNTAARTEAVIAGGERATDIGKAVTEVYKRARSVSHAKAERDRQFGIDGATNSIALLQEAMERAVDGVDKYGLDETQVESFRAGMVKMADDIRTFRKKIADLEYKQAVNGGGDSRTAGVKQSKAYLDADSEHEKVTKGDENSLDPGTIAAAIAAARDKRLADAGDESTTNARDYASASDGMRDHIDTELRNLEYVRDITKQVATTLDDIARQREQANRISARRFEAAGTYLQDFMARLALPSLGDAGEAFDKYLAATQDAMLAKKRDMDDIDAKETTVRTTGARNSLFHGAFFAPDKRKSKADLFTANKTYEALRTGAKTPEERNSLIAGQSRDYADAATAKGSRLDLRDVLQVQETLLTEALQTGNATLADTIRQTMDTLKAKLSEQAGSFKRYNARDFEKGAGAALTAGSRNGLNAVVDNIGNGKAIPGALKNIGIDTAKSVVKTGLDGIADNLQNELQNAGKKAGQYLAKEATKLLQSGGGQIGAAIGLAAAGAMIIGSKTGKKKTNSIIGGVLGAIGGGLLSGGNPAAISGGFTAGAALGGAFKDGGTAPGRKVSLFGEEGPELGVPEADMRILPADITERILSGGMGDAPRGTGSGTTIQITGPLQHIENVHDRTDADYASKSLTDHLSDRLSARG